MPRVSMTVQVLSLATSALGVIVEGELRDALAAVEGDDLKHEKNYIFIKLYM